MSLIKNIERIKYIDQLIRSRSTGNPEEFALKLGISRRQLFNLMSEFKHLGAPVTYSHKEATYIYLKDVRFVFDFERD